MQTWGGDPAVQILVLISTAGPFDGPFTGTAFDVANYGGRSYIAGDSGIQIDRGRSDEFSAFQSGTCSFTLRNDHREFDPTNASSPFISILTPMRRVQIVVAYGATFYSIFVGYIDGWPQSWTKTTGEVEIVAHDALSVMARALTTPSTGVLILDDLDHGRLDHARLAGDLPQQFTGERILSLLQLAGFTDGTNVEADTGITVVLPVEPTGQILSLIQDAEQAEAGFFFVRGDGVIVFYDRHSRFRKPRTANVQCVLTDDDYATLEVDRNLSQVWNDIEFSRPDGDPQKVTDQNSIHNFGVLSYSQTIPVISDGETLGRAEFWAARYGVPKDRPTAIQVHARRDMPGLFPKLLGMELLDRIQIQRTPLHISPTNTFTGLVEQVSHSITKVAWDTDLAISLIDIDDGANFMILDDATKGNLDQEALAY